MTQPSASRSEAVARDLERRIAGGELKVGERLPPERALAESYGVSRNGVREAIRALAAKGLLESRQGAGTYVRAASASPLANAVAASLSGRRERLREIFEFRRIVEPGIAALAARHATARDLERLKALAYDQERRARVGEDDADLDAAFHAALARAGKNGVLAEVMGAVQETLAESRESGLRGPERRAASLAAHLRLIDALERRDPDAAALAMREHLDAVERMVLGRPSGTGEAG